MIGRDEPDTQALGMALHGVSNAQLLDVTRLIDKLPNRSHADALLDPVRHRLAALRPTRRMNRNRLLFTPFDGVLVAAGKWRPGISALPRSLLAPLLALLDPPGGEPLPLAKPFDASDPLQVDRNGEPLWKAAADRLAGCTIPAAWAEPAWQARAGISMAMLEQMLPVAQLLLRRGLALRTLPSPQRPDFEGIVSALLREAAQRGPLAWGIMLILLFERASPDLIVAQALAIASGTRVGPMLQAGLDRAVDEWLTRIDQSRLLQPGDEADGPALLIDRLTTMQQIAALRRMVNRPLREQRRVASLSQSLAAVNRALFERTLTSRLQRVLEAARASGTDAGIAALEADIRSLRLFATTAARLEEDQDYDRLIETASLRLAVRTANTTEAHVACRLIELLGGSDRALQIIVSQPHQSQAAATRADAVRRVLPGG